MSHGAGSLALEARRAGPRTILERVRYDGISRCSRAFAHGDAALVVLSQLGPGVVRGDSIGTSGHLHAGAHLVVTNQSATRLMGGTCGAEAHATWRLDEGAFLELVGEPLVANAGARYEASTAIDLRAGACVLISELARVPADAEVRLRTSVRRFGRELYYDAFDAAAASPQAVGTFALIGIDETRVSAVIAALDGAAGPLSDLRLGDLRLGAGALPGGAFARVLANDIWAVRTALAELREAARSALRGAQATG